MLSTKPDERNLRFTIDAFSSADEGYPASELVSTNTSHPLKGWQSERFCTYPQTIIIRFSVGECRVRKIQVLSHHFKIASKLEFFIGKQPKRSPASAGSTAYTHSESSESMDEPANQALMEGEIRFARLGFVSLGENAGSNFKAREFKSVHVDEMGTHLKVVLHKNHINSLNLYNQVGLASLQLLGEYNDLAAMQNGFLNEQADITLDPFLPDIVPDFSMGTYQDQRLVQLVAAASKAKQEAVKAENFVLAQQLKILVCLCKKAADEVAKLLLLKVKSIEMEDYEMAEDAKEDIEQIRTALDLKITDLGLKKLSDGRIALADETADTDLPRQKVTTAETAIDVPKSTLDRILEEEKRAEAARLEAEVNRLAELARIQTEHVASKPATPIPPAKLDSKSNSKTILKTASEERLPPIQPMPDPPANAPPPITRSGSIPLFPKLGTYQTESSATLASQDTHEPLGDPEPLTKEQREKNALLIQVHGEFLARCLLSREFRLREQALEDVHQRLEMWRKNNKAVKKSKKQSTAVVPVIDAVSPGVEGDPMASLTEEAAVERIRIDWNTWMDAPEVERDVFIGGVYCAVERGLDDTREKALLMTLALWRLLNKTCTTRDIPKPMVFHYLNDLIPVLLIKSGHMNPRVKQGCLDLVVALAKSYSVSPHSIIKFILKPVKLNASPRYLVSRLNALHEVILKIGVDDLRQKLDAGSGLTVKAIMAFIEPLMHNKSADVREAAVAVFVDLAVALENDELMFSYLEHIRPQLVDIIQEKLIAARRTKSLVEQQKMKEIGKVLPKVVLPVQDSTASMNVDCNPVEANDAVVKLEEARPSAAQKETTTESPLKPTLKTNSEKELLKSLKSELDEIKSMVQEQLDGRHKDQEHSDDGVPSVLNSSEVDGTFVVRNDMDVVLEEEDEKDSDSVTRGRRQSQDKQQQHARKRADLGISNVSKSTRPQTSRQKSAAHSKHGSHERMHSGAKVVRLQSVERGGTTDKKRDMSKSRRDPMSPSTRTRTSTPGTPKRAKTPASATAAKLKVDIAVHNLKMNPGEEALANVLNGVCIFCNEKNVEFTEENLDIHYWRDCPMLCVCPLCHILIEIPTLTNHMHHECDNKRLVKQCSRCREMIMAKEFQGHVERQTCKPHSVIPGVARCALCHQDVPHGDSGWKTHLLHAGGTCTAAKRDPKRSQNELDAAGQTIQAVASFEPSSPLPVDARGPMDSVHSLSGANQADLDTKLDSLVRKKDVPSDNPNNAETIGSDSVGSLKSGMKPSGSLQQIGAIGKTATKGESVGNQDSELTALSTKSGEAGKQGKGSVNNLNSMSSDAKGVVAANSKSKVKVTKKPPLRK
ncbi:hypothetical protein BJ741DRAFT_627873 [Chytriomyces cf. hyalinus JEL632]|nr:hypothetical protein BJ741DRAFT_627873 [Chytriomyces cf. hyalinus JEL632]